MNEEFEETDSEQEELENEQERIRWFLNERVMAFVVLGTLGVLALGIYFGIQLYHDSKETEPTTVQKIKESADPDEMMYNDYQNLLASYGVKEPIETFVYNVQIPEEERAKLDTMYQDPYIGFEENEDLNASLFKVDEKYLFILFNPNTKAVVETLEWSDNNELSLQIYKLRGEKAVLTKETVQETNVAKKEENKTKIDEMNRQLGELIQHQHIPS